MLILISVRTLGKWFTIRIWNKTWLKFQTETNVIMSNHLNDIPNPFRAIISQILRPSPHWQGQLVAPIPALHQYRQFNGVGSIHPRHFNETQTPSATSVSQTVRRRPAYSSTRPGTSMARGVVVVAVAGFVLRHGHYHQISGHAVQRPHGGGLAFCRAFSVDALAAGADSGETAVENATDRFGLGARRYHGGDFLVHGFGLAAHAGGGDQRDQLSSPNGGRVAGAAAIGRTHWLAGLVGGDYRF